MSARRLPRAVLVFRVMALMAAAGRVQAAQTAAERPGFATSVEVVRLSVSVTDGGGQYVADLDEHDFAVFEDGKPQALSFFARERSSLRLLLMIDASSSMTDALPFVQAAASRLIRSLRPTDQARLVAFDARATVLVDFTADWEALLDAIERIRTGQHTALHNALYAELRALSRVPPRRLWRQAIVLLSDGEDTGSLVSEDRVLDLARRTDAVIYAIGPRPKHVPREARLSLGRAGYLLAALARETGGEAYFPRSASELEPIYRRIANGLAAQYTLGYVSSNRAADGSWRRLSVRTPAREGLALRHRTGYYAIAPGGRSSP